MECITTQTYHIKDEFVTYSPLHTVVRPTIPGAMRPHLVFAYITHIITCPTMPGAIRPHLVFPYIYMMPGAIRPHLGFLYHTMSSHIILSHLILRAKDHPISIHINNILCNASYSWILMQNNLIHIMAFHDAWFML